MGPFRGIYRGHMLAATAIMESPMQKNMENEMETGLRVHDYHRLVGRGSFSGYILLC